MKSLKNFNQGNDLVNLHLKYHSDCDMEKVWSGKRKCEGKSGSLSVLWERGWLTPWGVPEVKVAKGSFTLTGTNLRSKNVHQATGTPQPEKTNDTEGYESLVKVRGEEVEPADRAWVDIYSLISPLPKATLWPVPPQPDPSKRHRSRSKQSMAGKGQE